MQVIFQELVFILMGILYSAFNNYLRTTKTKLANSLAVRDEFLSIASHELKTPITTLILQLEISRMKIEQQAADVWPSIAKYFDKSKDQADKLVALIDDLLNVTRLEAGKTHYEKSRFDFSFLVKEHVEEFREQFELNRTPLTLHASDPVWLIGDRTKLGQVITNLLTNAMKYGNQAPVHITVAKENGMAKLVVQDQGIGIAADKHQKIFERFERAVSARSISGLGLGLFIAHSIVSHHNGKIIVESEPSKGSTFTVELPAEP